VPPLQAFHLAHRRCSRTSQRSNAIDLVRWSIWT
jgi:hypothetical protein